MTDLRDYKPLRLIAEDAEDLKILSACLQDAVIKVGDFAFLPKERRFAFVANRFVWECAADRKRGPFARVRAGAHFDDVISARQQNIRAEAKDAVLELLAMRFDPATDGAGVVIMEFSGGGAIQLNVESVNAQMRDLSAPWSTARKPDHKA